MRKGLICEAGRKDTIGRPILFGTTDTFLSHFGLESLEDLPPLPAPETEDAAETEKPLPETETAAYAQEFTDGTEHESTESE